MVKARGSVASRRTSDPHEYPYRGVTTVAERRTPIRNATIVCGVTLGLLGAVTGAAGGALVGALAALAHDYQRTHHIPDRPPASLYCCAGSLAVFTP